jgi:hypothetical protein
MENVREDVEQHDVQRAIDTILSSEGLSKKVQNAFIVFLE